MPQPNVQLDPNSFQPLSGATATPQSTGTNASLPAQASAQLSNVPSQQSSIPSAQTTAASQIQLDPNSFKPTAKSSNTDNGQGFDNDYLNLKIGELPSDVLNIVKGALHGGASTLGGIAKFGSMALPGVGPTNLGDIGNILESHSENTGQPGSTEAAAQDIGYGGETLAEFVGGEGALTTAKGLADTSKIMAVLEKSPKIIRALKLGAAALKAGTVQGTQTLARTGDLGEAAKSGAEMGATAGILGGAGELAGSFVSSVGKGAKAAGELADAAANAPDKQTVAENIQGTLHNAKQDLHTNYENQIKDFEGRLQGAEIDPKEAPIASKAEEILQKPDPEDHSSVAQLKDIRGEKLDKPVREFLENTATGKKPLTQEDIDAADDANSSKPQLLGADGKPVEIQNVEPEAQDQEPHDAHSLIQWRQQVRALAAEYPAGDVNARALNRLLYDGADPVSKSAFDDTFTNLAQQSDDPSVVDEYSALRNDYRNKISKYDDPVIKNLMAGKVDDAAKAFVGTKSASGIPTGGRTNFNLDNLKEVIGEKGMNQFRDEVFQNLMKNASDQNGFNPAQFISTYNRIADSTKSDFFGVKDPKGAATVQTQIQSLVTDAKSAANVQKLTRAGLLGAGVAAGALHPYVTGLATVLAYVVGHGGHGGLAAGRDLLDYVANNPKTWNALRGISKTAESQPVQATAGAALKGAKAITNQSQGSSTQRNGADAAIQALGNPKKGKPLTTLTDGSTTPTSPTASPDDLPSEVKNAVTTIPVQVKQGSAISDPNNRGGGVPIANVDQGAGNNTIEVNRPQDFGPAQKGHELVHVWQNNLPPSVQSKIPDDPQGTAAFDISDADKLRKQGKTLVDIPREKAATIVQKYIEDPKKNANLKPWIEDMGKHGLSITQPTSPDATKLNMKPRAPGLPNSSVAGMNK